MKRNIIIIGIILLSIVIFLLAFNYKQPQDPGTYYKVYLKDEEIGVISSKEELEDYINKQNESYKEKYQVSTVNAPQGLQIKRITTYSDKVDSVKDVYKQLVDKESFTVPGYQFTLRKDDRVIQIYVTDKNIFDEAIRTTMRTFVGTEDYTSYMENTQSEITTTGKIIEDIYVEESITTKKTNIPVTEKIYTSIEDLSQFLVFGADRKQETHIVKIGETITDIVAENQISVEEFLISNTQFTSEKNLLFPGQEVIIEMTNPQVSIAYEAYVVEDQETRYQTNYEYDETEEKGTSRVIQQGENGLERVSQRMKTVNGTIEYIIPIQKEELKPMVNEIVMQGTKDPYDVGSTTNWYWPTLPSGWTVSSRFGYRPNPWTGQREYHTGLDLAGTGCGSPIYAVTNGRVVESGYRQANGNYVCINHNNGYYTCYNHMSRIIAQKGDVVSRGETIGLIGDTGAATGCHLHLEVWKNVYPWRNGYAGLIDPRIMYPQVFGL